MKEKGEAHNYIVPPDFSLDSLDEEEVGAFAAAVAESCKGGEVFLLEGPLGAGKTRFTRALGESLGIQSGINSPTYVIQVSHPTPKGLVLHHLDFYRLTRPEEAEALGVEELNDPGSIVVVEWPDRCPGAFHEFTLRLRIHILDETHRSFDGWWGTLPYGNKRRLSHWRLSDSSP